MNRHARRLAARNDSKLPFDRSNVPPEDRFSARPDLQTRPTESSGVASVPTLAAGIERHRAGDLAAAEAIYRSVLQREPDTVQAWFLLGLIAQQTGHLDIAEALIATAWTAEPDQTSYADALANLRILLKQPAAALAVCDTTLTHHPNHPGLRVARAQALDALGQPDQALEIRPDEPVAG